MDALRFKELWMNAYCIGFDAARDELIYDETRSGEFKVAYRMGYEDGLESIR